MGQKSSGQRALMPSSPRVPPISTFGVLGEASLVAEGPIPQLPKLRGTGGRWPGRWGVGADRGAPCRWVPAVGIAGPVSPGHLSCPQLSCPWARNPLTTR